MAKSKSASGQKSSEATAEEIHIRAEPIELSRLLKYAGMFESGGEAKFAIQNGGVTVNGAVETAVRKQIPAGAIVACGGKTIKVALYR